MKRLIVYHSRLAEAMEQFVAFKRMQGRDYTDQAKTLSYFDCFLAGDRSTAGFLTPDLFRRYAATTEELTTRTRETRLSSLREFSRWLQARNPESAVLPKDILPRHVYNERFFFLTPGQVAELMAATTVVLGADRMRTRSVHTLLGLLYATGLRIAEALALTPRDLGPGGSALHVAKGKFGKERLMPVSPSTHAALTAFLAVRRSHAKRSDTSPLFIAAGGAALTYPQVYGDFRRLCRHCGLVGRPLLRLHDLRHNYACRRLALWRQEALDINAMLPILATAMGHVNILATQRYLHLDAVALQDAAASFNPCVTTIQESIP